MIKTLQCSGENPNNQTIFLPSRTSRGEGQPCPVWGWGRQETATTCRRLPAKLCNQCITMKSLKAVHYALHLMADNIILLPVFLLPGSSIINILGPVYPLSLLSTCQPCLANFVSKLLCPNCLFHTH